MRLAAVVHLLRRDGWPIDSRTIEVRCADGRKANVSSYFLRSLA
jgi:hypothetical protein